MPYITLKQAVVYGGEIFTAGQMIKANPEDMEMFEAMGAVEVDGRSGKPKFKVPKEPKGLQV